MNWYLEPLKKYATFTGRSRRKEYWMFMLFNFLISFALGLVDGILFSSEIGILSTIYSLFILVPSIALTVRRLHDIGKSGWWCLIGLIPVIGAIVLLVFACFDSQPGDNEYGPNPKQVA